MFELMEFPPKDFDSLLILIAEHMLNVLNCLYKFNPKPSKGGWPPLTKPQIGKAFREEIVQKFEKFQPAIKRT